MQFLVCTQPSNFFFKQSRKGDNWRDNYRKTQYNLNGIQWFSTADKRGNSGHLEAPTTFEQCPEQKLPLKWNF